MTRAWSAVATATVVQIIDTDNLNYKKLISQTFLIIILAIVACFMLGNCVIFVIWRVRNKIVQVYRVVEILLPYEVELALDRLRQTRRLISLGLSDQLVSKKQIEKAMKSQEAVYMQYRQKIRKQGLVRQVKVNKSFWFGFGTYALGIFVLLQLYQVICAMQIVNLESKVLRILDLQWISRCLISSVVQISNINLHAYYMSLAAANLTAPNMPTFEKMSPLMEALRKGSDNFQSQIINFITLLDP